MDDAHDPEQPTLGDLEMVERLVALYKALEAVLTAARNDANVPVWLLSLLAGLNEAVTAVLVKGAPADRLRLDVAIDRLLATRADLQGAHPSLDELIVRAVAYRAAGPN
jgi:hypothetical protein